MGSCHPPHQLYGTILVLKIKVLLCVRAGVKEYMNSMELRDNSVKSVLSFPISVASKDGTKVIRFVRQAPLPAEPSYQCYLQFLQEKRKNRAISLQLTRSHHTLYYWESPTKFFPPPPTWFQSQNHLEFSFPRGVKHFSVPSWHFKNSIFQISPEPRYSSPSPLTPCLYRLQSYQVAAVSFSLKRTGRHLFWAIPFLRYHQQALIETHTSSSGIAWVQISNSLKTILVFVFLSR